MSVLALVDLDAFVDDESRDRLKLPPPPMEWFRWSRSVPLVVGVAFNARTARAIGDFDGLERIADQVRSLVAPYASKVVVEPVLTLTMPEAVDAALLRLLGGTASPEAVGPFKALYLLTRDRGLTAKMRSVLESASPSYVPGTSMYRWILREPIPREFVGPAARPLTPPAPSLSPVVELLDDLPKCAAGRLRPAQCPGSLQVLAEVVDRHPWLLSQIGLTTNSVRGVARMRRYVEHVVLGGDVPHLEANPDDGVEIGVGPFDALWSPPSSAPFAEPASVGHGAISLQWPPGGSLARVTARTWLPPWLVCACTGSDTPLVPTAEGALVDDLALVIARLGRTSIELPDSPRAKVRFRAVPDGLECKLDDPFDELWWSDYRPRARATKRRKVTGLDAAAMCPVPAGDVDVLAHWLVDRLVLASPLAARTTLQVDAPIDAGTIGSAYDASGLVCAVLATRGPITGAVRCTSIQKLSRTHVRAELDVAGLADDLAEHLLGLPLVLPDP